jgi:hypothetical protein
MKKRVAVMALLLTVSIWVQAQEVKLKQYELKRSPVIGRFSGITICEGGISGLQRVDGTQDEYYLITDRGPNADASQANAGKETVLFPFPDYAPKIMRVRAQGDSLTILSTLALKRPDGTAAGGLPHPAGTAPSEIAWIGMDRSLPKSDNWGIDSESLAAGLDGDFWVGEEYGPSIWHVQGKTGRVIERFRPRGLSAQGPAIDQVFAKCRANRGFEAIAITPNHKMYAMLQAPLDNPDKAAGAASRLHRMLEIDLQTQMTRQFVYEHEAPTATLRNADWSVSDMAAVNNHEFLVIEHAARGGENVKKIFKIDLSQATPVPFEEINGMSLEQLATAQGCMANGIVPVQKTLFLDLLANGWNPVHKKPEGITIVNDSTIAVINDNDYGIASPAADGMLLYTGIRAVLYQFTLSGRLVLAFVPHQTTGGF